MLILADGEDVRDLLPPNDERIRLIHLVEAPQTIGDKRNLGCERAAGSVICHWDDDDVSACERISDHVRRMGETGLPVTGYHSMRFTDGERWWKYSGTPGYALGTSLCYARSYWEKHRFRSINVGEDNYFVECAQVERKIASVDAGEFMYATIHPGNTSPRNNANWKVLNNA